MTHLRERAGCGPQALVAAIGPYIGACCYEVDAPVLSALEASYASALAEVRAPTRPGHARIDLGVIVAAALSRAGLERASVGTAAVACTACDATHFHSFRRDGARAGRLVHWVRAAGVQG